MDIVSFVRFIDSKISHLIPEDNKPSLLVFYFHKIFKNDKDIYNSGVDPQQGTTLENFKEFIEYFLESGYKFIHPDDILNGLNTRKNKNNILITFDDGYYNNSFVLPLLKEYKTPALFFISSQNVILGEVFWWDILYRLKREGMPEVKVSLLKSKFKKINPNQIRKLIIKNFSGKAFKSINEYERPFSVDELKDFSKEQFVIIGNHTANHAILTNCNLKEVEFQIKQAQNDLFSITGKKPKYISYPNGNYAEFVIEAVKQQGLILGFSCVRGKNFLPIKGEENLLKIKRFIFPQTNNVKRDMIIYCSKFSLYNSLINIYCKFK
jgi:peptidoglycan/xylan/chitin deacetylase (PgdA/CDA1 family)